MPNELVQIFKDVQVGDVGTWTGTGLAALALWRGRRGDEWADAVAKMARLTPDQIRETVNNRPEIGEVVWAALETASRTGDDAKRRMLGRVAVAALHADEDVKLEHMVFFERTLRTIESPDIRFLATIYRLAVDTPKPGVTMQMLKTRWSEAGPFLGPMIQALAGASLIEDVGAKQFDRTEIWVVSDYGRMFLEFITPDVDWKRVDANINDATEPEGEPGEWAPSGWDEVEGQILRALVRAESAGEDLNHAARFAVAVDDDRYKLAIARLKDGNYIDAEVVANDAGHIMAVNIRALMERGTREAKRPDHDHPLRVRIVGRDDATNGDS